MPATEARKRGTSMKPNTRTVRKKTPSQKMENANAPTDTAPLATNPVATAIAPTQITSSHTEVPRTCLAKGRELQPISSITFASNVVAESHIATPRKTDCAGDHPNTLVPTV